MSLAGRSPESAKAGTHEKYEDRLMTWTQSRTGRRSFQQQYDLTERRDR
jgi:hypothetical protein